MKAPVLVLVLNILGIFLAFVMMIFYILYEKKMLTAKVMTRIWTIFGITGIAYGIFVLSIERIIREVYPERYSIGAWIIISCGIIILMRVVIKKIRK